MKAKTAGPRATGAHQAHRPRGRQKHGALRQLLTQTFSTLVAPLIVGLALQWVRGCDGGASRALPLSPAALPPGPGSRLHAVATGASGQTPAGWAAGQLPLRSRGQ